MDIGMEYLCKEIPDFAIEKERIKNGQIIALNSMTGIIAREFMMY